MGLINGLVKAGIAKKVIDEARKPANQAKIKRAAEQLMASRKGKRP